MTNFFTQKNIKQNKNVDVQEVHYYDYDVLVTDKYFLAHNVQFPIFHHRFLTPSTLESLRSYGHQNILILRNLIASATDYLSYMISFSNFYDTTMYNIMVKYDDTNMVYGTGKSCSGTDIAP